MPIPGRTPRLLIPIRNVGPRWMQTSEPRPGMGGVQWASCVFKLQEPKEPTEPIFPEGYIPHTIEDMAEAQFVNFNDPCD